MTLNELTACVAERWSPVIGDPQITGWVTVAAYVVAALMSAAVWLRLKGRRGRVFWAMVALLLAALAVNKQLDLQSALTAAGVALRGRRAGTAKGGWCSWASSPCLAP